MATIDEIARLMEKQLQPVRVAFQQIQDTLGRPLEEIANALAPIADFQENVIRSLAPINDWVSSIAEHLEELSEPVRLAFLLLGQEGWYISLDMPVSDFPKLGEALIAGEKEMVDEYCSRYFTENIARILNELISNHPERAGILKAAFKAHKEGQYELSIPVILAQSDGICFKLIEYQLYSKEMAKTGRVPTTSKYVEKYDGTPIITAFLEPLRSSMPISYSKRERDDSETSLNRHAILHGESVNYATEINSLKAISLINYISSTLLHIEQNSI